MGVEPQAPTPKDVRATDCSYEQSPTDCEPRDCATNGSKYVDFYCPIAKLAIELDGSIHNLLDNKTHDLDRTSYLESLGIRVLRFKNEQIFNDAENVKKAILEALEGTH